MFLLENFNKYVARKYPLCDPLAMVFPGLLHSTLCKRLMRLRHEMLTKSTPGSARFTFISVAKVDTTFF